jgi:hypothetical protein
MIPQIAQHPRHLSQQFGSPGFATLPFDSLQSPRIPDRLGPLPFRSPRNLPSSSPLAPLHRPYAVESRGPSRVGVPLSSPSQGYGGQYHDPAEHMLRRKTPNGTLAAGYDGTPVQWANKAPALKHVLLPTSNSGVPAIKDEGFLRQRSNSLGWNYQPITQFRGDGGVRMNSDPGNWTYAPFSNPTNVLDHLSMQQATTFYPNNGMQIPTVLQPPYQPSPGPTASNDGGLYGPYWPDGKFVPYRPAAYREQGHHQHNGYEFNFNGPQQQMNSHIEFTQPFRQPQPNISPSHHAGTPTYSPLDTSSRDHETAYMPQQHPRLFLNNASIYSPTQDF